MTWRGQSSPTDRIFAALVYLLPVMRALPFGAGVLSTIPMFGQVIWLAIGPFLLLYGALSAIPFAQLIIFFALYLGVVRNYRFSHFLRYNVMQALLIGMATSIVGLLLSILGTSGLIVETLFALIFFVAFGSSVYCLVRSATGLFPELPVISDAAYQYIR